MIGKSLHVILDIMDRRIVGIVVAILIVGTVVGLYSSKNIKREQQAKRETSKEVIPSENLNSYTDPAGFSFSYSDNVALDKKEELDNTTYADLKLISDKVTGSVSVSITDTKLKNIEEWVRQNPGNNVGREVMLGGISGQEFTIGERVTTVSIDKGVLFIVEANLKKNKDFWQKVYSQVVSSITFTNSSQAGNGTSSVSQDDVIFEGEEVVE